jgi:hypothetical protein
MAFILGLGSVAYLLKTLNASNLQAEQDKKTYQALNEAKQALISWAVSHPNTPGLMPYPDRNADGNYDDTSDCYASNVNFAPHFTLGRLPLFKNDPNCVNAKNTVSAGLADDFRDGTGERLWYEVSRNLLHDYKNNGDPAGTSPIINPSIVNAPGNPWFVVRDRNGAVISNRVAAVIMAPGSPSATQDRSGGIADANQYLDKIVMADGTQYKNYGYQASGITPVQEFIIGDDFRVVAKNDPAYKNQAIEPYYYNDKLVYITIDELMYALEKRVLMEAKTALNTYYATNSYYPFAAGLGSATNQNQCTQGNLRGLLPVMPPSPHTCTCTAAIRTCLCNFGVVSTISFTRSAGTFVADGAATNAPTGACSVQLASTNTCTCNGAGSCKKASGATQFSCDACGNCTATVAGVSNFETTGVFSSSTGGCANTPGSASCSTIADGTFTLGACNVNETIKSLPAVGGVLPVWFLANQWEKYIVYAVSNDCISTGTCLATASPPKITVGLNQNINAIVAASVVNPNNSCSIANYLSSTENTNLTISNGMQDLTYQKTQPKMLVNTDQIVVTP